MLVPATPGQGRSAVFIVDPSADGFALTRLATTTGDPEAHVDLDGVRAGRGARGPPTDGREIMEWMRRPRHLGDLSALAGVCKQAGGR